MVIREMSVEIGWTLPKEGKKKSRGVERRSKLKETSPQGNKMMKKGEGLGTPGGKEGSLTLEQEINPSGRLKR